MADADTLAWSRGPADAKAALAGCRFDVLRGSRAVWWIERYCRLYEGSGWAGQPLRLHSCLECAPEPDIPRRFADPATGQVPPAVADYYRARAARHNACRAAGHHLHWQYECLLRLFGWVRPSERWGGDIRRFRRATIFVPKKNGKSPTLAAVGLYLLCGDGEPGQKVFLGAKDGQQAREIAGKHAVEMLHQSVELDRACTVNKSVLQITHEKSRSLMRPLSSSNSRTQESKEGINGCVLIDETHVVDREFVARISRAGISRRNPLQLEVSTAGNNPDGYGKEQFDYALQVLSGERDDPEFFAAVYAAPQDLPDADLAADPLKYGRLANPALGHTVDPEEFLSDYQRSRSSIQKLADFRMYRLNIWQRSANPWLRASNWDACREDFTAETLEGQDCYAALDLSKKQDMSSLVLGFPGPEATDPLRLLPFFWLPEEVARDKDHLVPFLTWHQQGHLELTPGNVIDNGFIEGRFRDLVRRFRILKLFFDPWHAEDVTQRIEQGQADHLGHVLVEGTGVEREEFRQDLKNFAAPCNQFERMVLSGQLRHNGNPILTWQAGHVQVKADFNQNLRPVKPPHGDIKKIDGIVAAVMCIAAWMKYGTPEPSCYEQPGSLSL